MQIFPPAHFLNKKLKLGVLAKQVVLLVRSQTNHLTVIVLGESPHLVNGYFKGLQAMNL